MKMKIRILILILLLSAGLLKGQIPLFERGVYIQYNNTPILLGNNYDTAPCVVDWNNDGRKDLLVGCFYNGSVYLYTNSGTDEAPVLNTRTKLQADGRDIAVPYG